ncbi:Hypothetical protein, putative [Bodo saltans]|uniref:Uncharacterized protein n=1 Tax=Bodo saltans TaxID=75058 RepID=A0A0S4IXT5_BODSA|nr:Hypothetical protein, putative [Bodo saltans]|eukprot:CUG43870.1 Hypothetical protein, putative [Bodo saltans]
MTSSPVKSSPLKTEETIAATEEDTTEEQLSQLVVDEVELREVLELDAGTTLEDITSEALTEHQYFSRSHVCRLCFRWFGFTYAASHGHYTDTKGDFIRRQRSRNRKPSYLLCASCGDLPLLCHACFRMVHLQQDPVTVTSIESLQSELKKRDEASRSPSAVQDDSRDASNVSPGSQLEINSVASDHHTGVPATLLKRIGLATLAVAFGTDRHAPLSTGATLPQETAQRHVALEMFTLDPRVAARQRAEVRKTFSLSMESFFETSNEDAASADIAPQVGVAKSVLIEREAQRRKEISEIWFSERFASYSLEFLTHHQCQDTATEVGDAPIVPQLTITMPAPHNEGEVEEGGGVGAFEEDVVADAPFPTGSFHSLPDGSTTSVGSPPASSSPAYPLSTYVDTFGLAFVVEAFDAQGEGIVELEAAELQSLKEQEVKSRDLLFAHVASEQAMSLVVTMAASSVYLRQAQRDFEELLEELQQSIQSMYQDVILVEVIRVLDGTALFERGAFHADPVDDDGTPITLLWMQFYHSESVARRGMWDEQLSEWSPLLRDAQWRSQQTERFLLVRQLQQQHNFQANQLLRQFLVGHSALVAEKMSEFLQIMADKAESRVEQLSMQCVHAVSRQEMIEEERLLRWRTKQQYSVSRLSSREATQRRLLVAESLLLHIREMPNEEKLKRFSMEREFVVEYRGLMKLFITATRIDLTTLLRNCPLSFESGLGDWTRRLVNREVSYFSYHRDRLTVSGPCGIPLHECFVWPPDPCRQLSLFWCPKYGPPRKKMIVVQGQVTRTVKGRQRVVKLPGSHQTKLLGVGGDTEAAITPRGQSAPPQTFSSPTSQSRLVDDGPQPLLTALSVVSALLDVPSDSAGRRFSCVSLVEDIVCWNKVCQQGQVLLGSYQEANAFDDLFANFEETVTDDAEMKWATMVGTRERERLAKLEEAFAGRGPPKVRSTPMTEANKRPKKGRRRHISDSASSVISADDAASAVSTSETARSKQSTKSGESDTSQHSAVADIPDNVFHTAGARELSVAILPNYMMGQSFFGTKFMFGGSVHLFERQWMPPITAAHMSVPMDVSEAWGQGPPDVDHDVGDHESGEEEAVDEDEEMDSDFSDDAVAASMRKRDAYLGGTEASRLRQEKKFEDKVREAEFTAQLSERRSFAALRKYWAMVRQKQEEDALLRGVVRAPASTSSKRGRIQAKVTPTPLDVSILSRSQEQQLRDVQQTLPSGKRGGSSATRTSPGQPRNTTSPSTRSRPGQKKNRSASVVLTDAFDMFDE